VVDEINFIPAAGPVAEAMGPGFVMAAQFVKFSTHNPPVAKGYRADCVPVYAHWRNVEI
jgi:hypothetical protein